MPEWPENDASCNQYLYF